MSKYPNANFINHTNRSHPQVQRPGDGIARIVSGRDIVADLRSGWSSRVELEPGSGLFARLHSAFEQESTKVVRVFNSAVLVPDYGDRKFEARYTNR